MICLAAAVVVSAQVMSFGHCVYGIGSTLFGKDVWDPQGFLFILQQGKHLPNGGFTANYKGPWKHDLFHSDHRSYRVKDIERIREATLNAGGAGSVTSPDGKNVIRLYANPLAYEVVREGVTVVAKSEIGLTVDGARLDGTDATERVPPVVKRGTRSGVADAPVYKKSKVDLSANEAFVNFGAWGVRLVARNDGIAYRFERTRTSRGCGRGRWRGTGGTDSTAARRATRRDTSASSTSRRRTGLNTWCWTGTATKSGSGSTSGSRVPLSMWIISSSMRGRYVHETRKVRAGEKIPFHMAPGGGFVARCSRISPKS